MTLSEDTLSKGANGPRKSLNAIKSQRPPSSRYSKKSNFAKVHAQQLPLSVHPLPAFIPHNPLSLVRIAYALLSGILYPPTSNPDELYHAYFSPETRSVHVIDPTTIRALWEKGFFGKGSLSRSEPNWLDTERRRLGILKDDSLASEEMTSRRRMERLEMKMERAKSEAEAIQDQLRKEAAALSSVPEDAHGSDESFLRGPLAIDETESTHPQQVLEADAVDNNVGESVSAADGGPNGKDPDDSAILPTVKNEEHLQLSLEEAFFLSYALGVLHINLPDRTSHVDDNSSLLQLFRQQSYFPPAPSLNLRPDDPFLMHYVVYHHFRSLGWVVRDGVKFAVDYLLYERGPVFKHAEFAVVIIPDYSHQYWAETQERQDEVDTKRAKKSWHWLHCVSRVQSQVMKTLVMVYLSVPPPESIADSEDIGKLIRSYKIREFCIKRFSTNRNR